MTDQEKRGAARAKPRLESGRVALVVLGMHRSGTSALTRTLNLLGASVPTNLIEADSNNQSGYWEPGTLNALNNEMLKESGSRWDDWREFDPTALGRERLAHYRKKIRTLVQQEYGRERLFLIKDPRISRFVFLYEAALTDLDVVPVYIIASRNPLSVLDSLEKRDGMTADFASFLWLRNTLDAEEATRGKRRCLVHYEDFLQDWRQTVEDVGNRLDVVWPRAPQDAATDIDAYLTRDLQHHIASKGQLQVSDRVEEWVREAYLALCKLKSGKESRAAQAELTRIRKEFGTGAAVFGKAVFPELAVRENRLANRCRQLEALDSEKETAKVALEESVAALTLEVSTWREESAVLERSRATLADENSALTEQLAKQGREMAEHARSHAALQQSNASTAARLVEARRQMRALHKETQSLSEQVSALTIQLSDQRSSFAALQNNLAELEGIRATLVADLIQSRSEEHRLHNVVDAIYSSTSWRASAPLRGVGYGIRSMRAAPSLVRHILVRRVYMAWHNLPLTSSTKQKLKGAIFTSLPFVFGRTGAYRSWKNFTGRTDRTINTGQASSTTRHSENNPSSLAPKFVPLLEAAPPKEKPVRVIAFYLPQFHPIPENDEWWGNGFTEWTNVRPAQPQFINHYQPHVPGELGYYDLRDRTVQLRQIDLAKLYGIEGFCFYFYWFGGRRLLEGPVEAWRDDKSLDLPFCLCWANENWSRRWDGLDQEILIGQKHSPSDDVAFIAEVATYLTDPRYIRIDGKPLLLVYRPSLLPSAKETAARWRQWCRENGIGEIYLAYTQAFEKNDPAMYGFDAAVEFPPNNSAPPNVTHEVEPLQADFAANVYDWSVFVERSEPYARREYKLHRSVCPGWDNTARRRSGASIFINNTPALYQRWLENAVKDTVDNISDPSERLIFINAWNEWAEGAHLEPDAATGYAYLQATRNALERSGTGTSAITQHAHVAIVIHAFYPDVLSEILTFVDALPERHKMFVTTTDENAENVQQLLDRSGRSYSLRIVRNRGRDVLPFFLSYRDLKTEGFEFLLKVHTKKSPHRIDGRRWRQDLYQRLLSPDRFSSNLEALVQDRTLGIVGPQGHYVPMTTYIGSNEGRIISIGRKLGLTDDRIYEQGFFAGTMFMARSSALEPLDKLNFGEAEFEPEAGQIDGTMAHAIERAMALSAVSAGLRLVTDEGFGSATATLTNAYSYAQAASDIH